MKELRKLAEAASAAQDDILLTPNAILQLLDRLEAQAAEIERLIGIVSSSRRSMVELVAAHLDIEDALQAKLDAMTERMLDADASIDRLEKAEREIERLTEESAMHSRVAQKAIDDVVALKAKLDAAAKVPLSADVLNSLWGDAVAVGDPTAGNLHIRYARLVEAAHNIKGTTP